MNQVEAELKAKELSKHIGNFFKHKKTGLEFKIESVEAKQVSGSPIFKVWVTYRNANPYLMNINSDHQDATYFFETHQPC